MVQFRALLASASDRLDRLLLLALVPLFASLASPGNFARIAADTSDFRIGISFGLPSAVATSWDFLSLPNPGSGITVYPPGLDLVQGLALVFVAAAFTGLLASVYLATLGRDLFGSAAVTNGALRYAPALIAFELLVALVTLGVFGLATVSLVLALPGFAVVIVLAYLFYPTPYLVVLEDASLGRALGESYALAQRGGEYTSFFVKYLLVAAAVSVVSTPLFTTSVAGALAATFVLAPVCVLFNAVTMLFLGRLTERGGEGTDGPHGWDPDAVAGQSLDSSSNMPVDM